MNESVEQESSAAPQPESTDNSASVETEEEIKIFAPQNKLPFPEQEINLNEVFPEEDNDLNDLFPDEETRQLLKKVQRNKKDLHTMTDRFNDEVWTDSDTSNPVATQEPNSDSSPVESTEASEPSDTP